MPRNNDLKKILLIGSGPIVIGQGCEFDYSGVQACKALREEGYQVVLVNSNPATIMTDPEFADRTYIEPITAEVIEAIIAREKPDALLPTMGGQTALNAAMELYRNGALARHKVKLIGANAKAIAKGEDRQLFKEAMLRIGLDVPRSGVARSLADTGRIAKEIGTFPLIIRPAFTLGGSGGGIRYYPDRLDEFTGRAFGARALLRARRPDFRSRRSQANSRSVTRLTKSKTTSRARRRPVSSQRSIIAWSKCRGSRSKNFPRPIQP